MYEYSSQLFSKKKKWMQGQKFNLAQFHLKFSVLYVRIDTFQISSWAVTYPWSAIMFMANNDSHRILTYFYFLKELHVYFLKQKKYVYIFITCIMTL